MKYVLLMMGDMTGARCGDLPGSGPEDFQAYFRELGEAGVLREGFSLEDPADGTSVTKESIDAEAVVTAGPYAESREFVGGAFTIEVATLDEAIAWARRCPGAIGGRVEIRPLAAY